MKSAKISSATSFNSEIVMSPDKSISHRAAIMAGLATGKTKIKNYLLSEDTLNTLKMLEMLGVHIERHGADLTVTGAGMSGLRAPDDVIYLGNSGTALRVSAGFLAAQDFITVLTGDASLRRRPMKRIIKPLRQMGAHIISNNDRPPLIINGSKLRPITYKSRVASAQVKTSIMLAALYADGETIIEEPAPSRDHTERLFRYLNIPFEKTGNRIQMHGIDSFSAKDIYIPGDISSAAFFIVYTILKKDSRILIKNVNLNETRAGLLTVLDRMGIKYGIENQRELNGEALGDIRTYYQTGFKGVNIGGADIPKLIDELPVISVLMSFATGASRVTGAHELRVKESDRIKSIADMLRAFNVDIKEFDDGFEIQPSVNDMRLNSDAVESYADHRIAMSSLIFSAVLNEPVSVRNAESINTSFKDFFSLLNKCGAIYEFEE